MTFFSRQPGKSLLKGTRLPIARWVFFAFLLFASGSAALVSHVEVVHAQFAAAPAATAPAASTTTTSSSASKTSEATTIGPVDWLVLQIAGIVLYVVQGVGQLIVMLIGGLVVPLMQYNNFATSPVIGTGWAIIRDAMNMFFVVVLIAIAFGTVIGYEKKFQWRQQVPNLLKWAIIINFSRTLCGLMIDASQVITLTFANALKDIAGGNFIEMFGMRHIMDLNVKSDVLQEGTRNAAAQGVQPFDVFIAALIALGMMMAILVAVTFLTIILAYRIVALWILVATAPLAWFTKAAEGVAPASMAKAYSQWWSRFNCMLYTGPVLTFFLWLSLAVAGSGNIGAEQFAASSASSSEGGLDVGNILGAMDTSRMTSFIIGLALLFAGFDATKDACGGGDSMVGGLIGKAGDLGKQAAKLPLGAAALAGTWSARKGLQAGRAVGRSAYANTAGRALAAGGNVASNLMSKVSKNPPIPLPRSVRIGLGNAAAGMEARRAAKTDLSIKNKKPMTTDMKAEYLKAGMTGLAGRTEGGRNQYLATLRQAMEDPEMREELGTEGMKQVLEGRDPRTGERALDTLQKNYKGDANFTKKFKDLQKTMPSIFGKDILAKNIVEQGDITGVDKSQWSDKDFREHVKGMGLYRDNKGETRFRKGDDGKDIEVDGKKIPITISEALEQGLMGERMKKQWVDGSKAIKEKETPERVLATATPSIEVNQLTPQMLTPEVSVKLMSEGSKSQVEAMAKRQELKQKMREQSKTILAVGTEKKGMKDEQRVALRTNMHKMGVDLADAFEFDATKKTYTNADRKTSEFTVGFANERAEEDFRKAAKEDTDVVLEATKDPTSELAKVAAGSMSKDTVKKLIKQYQDMKVETDEDVQKKKAFEEQVKGVFAAVLTRRDEIDAITDEVGGSLPNGSKMKSEKDGLEKILQQQEFFRKEQIKFDTDEQEIRSIRDSIRPTGGQSDAASVSAAGASGTSGAASGTAASSVGGVGASGASGGSASSTSAEAKFAADLAHIRLETEAKMAEKQAKYEKEFGAFQGTMQAKLKDLERKRVEAKDRATKSAMDAQIGPLEQLIKDTSELEALLRRVKEEEEKRKGASA